MTKRCIILNPRAGRGTAMKHSHALLQALRKAELSFDLVTTSAPHTAMQFTSNIIASGKYEQIVAVGGDGTLNEVVNGIFSNAQTASTLQRSNISLGIVPLGTGNDFIKSLDGVVANDIDGAVSRLVSGVTTTIDVGQVTITDKLGTRTRYFLNDLGLGIYAYVAAETHKIKRLQGWSVYAVAVARALAHYRAYPLHVHCTNRDIHRSVLLACITNGRYQGAGFCLTPDALLNDGQCDICVIDAVHVGKTVRHLPSAIQGTHTQQPEVTMGRSDHIIVTSETPILASTDGEIITTNAQKLEIRVLPNALDIVGGVAT